MNNPRVLHTMLISHTCFTFFMPLLTHQDKQKISPVIFVNMRYFLLKNRCITIGITFNPHNSPTIINNNLIYKYIILLC